MKTYDYEILYTALTEMAETPESEGLEVGLGYACDVLDIPVDVERHKKIMAFYGKHRAKLSRAFQAGKQAFFDACDEGAAQDAQAQA